MKTYNTQAEIEDIHEARRIICLLHADIKEQYYGKVFFGCLSAIMLLVGFLLGVAYG